MDRYSQKVSTMGDEEAPNAQATTFKYVGTIGRMDTFNDNTEDIETYIERLDQYFMVNDIPDTKKVPALLSLVGPKIFKLLKSLVAPTKPGEKTYEQLCEALTKHFQPMINRTAERYRFHTRVQRSSESINDYLAALKQLSLNCNFEQDLEQQLCDVFIRGMYKKETRTRLISQPDITLAKAVKMATSHEQAAADAVECGPSADSSKSVNSVRQRRSTRPPSKPTKKMKPCYRCRGRNHTHDDCYYKEQECGTCGKIGHISRACKTGKRDESGPQDKERQKKPRGKPDKSSRSSRVHQVHSHHESDDYSETEVLNITDVNTLNTDKFMVKPQINGVEINMEIDTGSGVTLIHESTYKEHFSELKLDPSETVLQSFTGELFRPLGTLSVDVRLFGTRRKLLLHVTRHGKHSLLGRDWIRALPLEESALPAIKAIKQVCMKSSEPPAKFSTDARVNSLVNQHRVIFEPGIGKLNAPPATFRIKPDSQPIFIKARPIPFALKDKVKAELTRLEQQDIISPVKFSDYATPIVPVLKRNGDVRICGDFKCTINKVLEPEQYPLPKIDEIFASFAGGQKFSKIDLTQAYLSYPIADEHKKYVTISTPFGLYQYNRLLYGIGDAPAKWQKVMDQVLEGIPMTRCILDDIITSGENDEDHLQNLRTIFERLATYGLKANNAKCEFFKSSIKFCGHVISDKGLQQDESKVKAIVEAPAPQNVSELLSWLGMVTYYHKFLPNIAAKLQPLYDLTKDDVKWE